MRSSSAAVLNKTHEMLPVQRSHTSVNVAQPANFNVSTRKFGLVGGRSPHGKKSLKDGGTRN